MTLVPRLAAITGATGFLGQHLVRAFAERGWSVRLLARRDPISLFWQGLNPEVVIGELSDREALRRLCDGAEVTVHAAALLGGAPAELHRANAEGARRVAEAAEDAGLILISSLAARHPELSPYAASKRAGEEACRAARGARLTIVRPPAVYGPGDRETLRLFALAARSPVLPVLGPEARLALIHVQDAARQVAWLADQGRPGLFALSDEQPEGYGWRDIMGAAAAAFDRRCAFIQLSSAAVYAMATADGFVNSWRRTKGLLTFGKVTEMTHSDWSVRPEERMRGAPAAEFDLPGGFRQTAGWYQAVGWL